MPRRLHDPEGTTTRLGIQWVAAQWPALRTLGERPTDDADSDLLPNWLDPDKDSDGKLDAFTRQVLELGPFQSVILAEHIEVVGDPW